MNLDGIKCIFPSPLWGRACERREAAGKIKGGGRSGHYHFIHNTFLNYQTPTSALPTGGREKLLGLPDSIPL